MGWVCGPSISGSQTIKEQFWQCRAVLSFPKKELVLTVLWSSLFSKERTRLWWWLCSSLFFKERTHLDECCVVLSFPKKELILTSVVQFSLFQRKNSSWRVLCGSPFSKERTHLDECCAVLSFSKKGRVSKGQVYIYIYIYNKRFDACSRIPGCIYLPQETMTVETFLLICASRKWPTRKTTSLPCCFTYHIVYSKEGFWNFPQLQ